MEFKTLEEEKLKQNLQLQLTEIEMLQSMYPNPGELKFDENFVASDIQQFINDESKTLPPFIDFTLYLAIGDTKFELCINLSPEYPDVEPDIFIRNNKLNRLEHTKINKDCNEYIATIVRGEPCIFSIISWLQENTDKYEEIITVDTLQTKSDNEDKLIRLWIYSHHIYNKSKRREILNLANHLKISGFCMPGKPGIICVEGYASDCNEWWTTIKSMTWKRIFCKVTEECKNPDTFLKFKTFEEIAFVNSGARCNHMDMGELYKYLEKHELAFIFKELFGVDGKSNQ